MYPHLGLYKHNVTVMHFRFVGILIFLQTVAVNSEIIHPYDTISAKSTDPEHVYCLTPVLNSQQLSNLYDNQVVEC